MGSLVPGWNSVGNLPPIDLRNSLDEEEEPKGYFAKLQKNRSLRRASTDNGAGGTPDLSRRSAPVPVSPSAGSPRARDALFGHPSSPVEMRRSTEWNDTLEVGSAPLAGGSGLDKYRSDKGRRNKYRWWKKLSSGFLNEMYEDEHLAKDTTRNSFVPQYTVTGQNFNYRVETKESADKNSIDFDDEDTNTNDQKDEAGSDPQAVAAA